MFCPSCGSEIPDNAKFCPECGSNTGGQASASPNVKIQESIVSNTSLDGTSKESGAGKGDMEDIRELMEVKARWDRVLEDKKRAKQELELEKERARHDMEMERLQAESEARARWLEALKEAEAGGDTGRVKSATMLKARLLRDFERSIEGGDVEDAYARGAQVVERFKNEIRFEVLEDLKTILEVMKESIRRGDDLWESQVDKLRAICQVLWEAMPIEQLEDE